MKKARAYKIKHSYNVKDSITRYQWILQLAIDYIWENIDWVEKKVRNYYTIPKTMKNVKLLKQQGKKFKVYGKKIYVYYTAKRLIPKIPRSPKFVKELRDYLQVFWKQTSYASHYVDSAIRTSYWILESWRENYLNSKFKRRKPTIKSRFARIKNSLFRVRDGELILTIVPRQIYQKFKLDDKWFYDRIKDWKLGEIILKDKELILMFTKETEDENISKVIGWDMNMFTMDGYGDEIGAVKKSIKELYRIHITYHNKRRKIQKMLKKNPKQAKRLLKKLSKRERDKVRDFIYKFTTEIAREFQDYVHVFEDLNKEAMYNRSKKHNRNISLHDWRKIVEVLKYKVKVVEVDPKFTTKTCSRCGSLNTVVKNGTVKCLDCNLEIDRQLNASINIYLKGKGLKLSHENWVKLGLTEDVGSLGVPPNGAEPDDVSPMNPEGNEGDVAQGEVG
ncbi:MAG: RNA-guided endonuclease InsQ/TnpB family protein [Candidatus Njordarchaeia archaeon]|nr:transposase [Candidatus Korarchaeota archaeon]